MNEGKKVMLKINKFAAALAVIGSGAVITACAGSQANSPATEVPSGDGQGAKASCSANGACGAAKTEKTGDEAATPAATPDAAAGPKADAAPATNTAPATTAAPATNAVAAPATTTTAAKATPTAAKPVAKKKSATAKKPGAEGGCGEGGCG